MVFFYYPVDLEYVEQKKKTRELGLKTANYNSKFQVCENGAVLWSLYFMSKLRYIYRTN